MYLHWGLRGKVRIVLIVLDRFRQRKMLTIVIDYVSNVSKPSKEHCPLMGLENTITVYGY